MIPTYFKMVLKRHAEVEFGRGLCTSSPESNPTPQAGSAKADCPGPPSFEYFQEWSLHSLSGKSVSTLDHHHSRDFFLCLSEICSSWMCVCCPFLCHLPPLQRVCLHFIYYLLLVCLDNISLTSSSTDPHSPLLIQEMLQPSLIFEALLWHHSSKSLSFSC